MEDEVEERSRGPSSRTVLVLLALSLVVVVVLVSTTIVAKTDDDGRYTEPTDNSYMDDAEYVTSGRCADCHNQPDTWVHTLHSKAFGNATSESVVGDFTVDPTIEVADGVEVTLDLTSNASGLFMDLNGSGTHVYQVSHVQGAGYWLQAYLTTYGSSRYILPIAWATDLEVWVPFHTEEWYDDAGVPEMADADHTWDRMCVACHTTGARVEYLQPDDFIDQWVATWAEPGVACEACHGPGGIHQDPPEDEDLKDYIWHSMGSEICGNCHGAGTSVGKVGGMETLYSLDTGGNTIRPGDDLSDFLALDPLLHPDGETSSGQAQQYNEYITSRHSHSMPTLLGAEGRQDFCLMCHSTDYLLADEQPDLETAAHDIECALCHDMHGTENENNLRLDKWDTCVQCHRNGDRVPGEDPLPPHKEIITGSVPIDGLSGDPWMGGDVMCTDCHMPPLATRVTPNDIPIHSWTFVSPQGSIDHDMPNSCTVACHQDAGTGGPLTDEQAMAYISNKRAQIQALVHEAEQLAGKAMEAMEAAPDLGFSAADVAAANATLTDGKFVLAFVKNDASEIHNPSWQMTLLSFSIDTSEQVMDDLMPGTVNGSVVDGDGKGISGLKVMKGNRTWATTGADGTFSLDIVPGTHSFDVMDGEDTVDTFDATVTAGETTDVGDLVQEEEGEEGTDYTDYYIIIAVVIVLVIIAVLVMGRSGGGEE